MTTTQIRIQTYAKFTPKQKATVLAILHVPSATLANWPFIDSHGRAIGHGVLMLQVMMSMSLHDTH